MYVCSDIYPEYKSQKYKQQELFGKRLYTWTESNSCSIKINVLLYGIHIGLLSTPTCRHLPELTPEMLEYLKGIVQKRGRGLRDPYDPRYPSHISHFILWSVWPKVWIIFVNTFFIISYFWPKRSIWPKVSIPFDNIFHFLIFVYIRQRFSSMQFDYILIYNLYTFSTTVPLGMSCLLII